MSAISHRYLFIIEFCNPANGINNKHYGCTNLMNLPYKCQKYDCHITREEHIILSCLREKDIKGKKKKKNTGFTMPIYSDQKIVPCYLHVTSGLHLNE